MQHLVSAKTLFLICGLYAGCLALPSGTGYAFSGTDNPPGLRLVGRTVDGAIVIDGSYSQLTDLETIAVITVLSTLLAIGLFQLRWSGRRRDDDDRHD